MSQYETDPHPESAAGERKQWISPEVRRIRAGDAENSFDSDHEDGGSTFS